MLNSQRFDPASRYRVATGRGIDVSGPVNHISLGEEVPAGLLTPAAMFGLFVMGAVVKLHPTSSAPIPPDEEDDDDDYTPPVAAAVSSARSVKPSRRKSRR